MKKLRTIAKERYPEKDGTCSNCRYSLNSCPNLFWCHIHNKHKTPNENCRAHQFDEDPFVYIAKEVEMENLKYILKVYFKNGEWKEFYVKYDYIDDEKIVITTTDNINVTIYKRNVLYTEQKMGDDNGTK